MNRVWINTLRKAIPDPAGGMQFKVAQDLVKLIHVWFRRPHAFSNVPICGKAGSLG
jgi:hypothetical protein